MEHGWNEDEALPPEGAQVFSPETMVTSDRDGCIIYLLDRAKRNKEKEVKKKKTQISTTTNEGASWVHKISVTILISFA